MLTTSTNTALELQLFGTFFIILIAFLGMMAWLIRRIDAVKDQLTDVSGRISNIEGKLDAARRRA